MLFIHTDIHREQDQRIVNLMMSRHEEEERSRKERLMLELEWDEQRKIEEQLKKARQQQRQAEIWDTYKAKDAKQFEVRARRLRNEQRLKKDQLERLLSRDSAWLMEKRKQEQIRGTKMLAKKIKETEKKTEAGRKYVAETKGRRITSQHEPA